eukprot:gene37764-46595_t
MNGKVRSAPSQKAPVSGVWGRCCPGGWYARCNFSPHRCSNAVGLLDNRLWAGKAFDGAWSTALSTARDAVEPATGQVLSRVGIASAADMQAAIGRAQQAQAAWAATGPRERAAVFHRAASIFEQHFDELAMTVARETGGIVPKGQHEVREAITLCQLAAALPMQAQGQSVTERRP